jgi:glutathione S-transferase
MSSTRRRPSTIERYKEQVKRVLGVFDGWLEGKQWFVGDKTTFYPDLALTALTRFLRKLMIITLR